MSAVSAGARVRLGIRHGWFACAALGALYGATTWCAYAAVEIADCALRPIAIGVRDLVAASHWRFSGLLVAFYGIAGGLLGALAALPIGRRGRWGDLSPVQMQAAATMTLVAAYAANLVFGTGPRSRVALLLAITLLALLSALLMWPNRFGRVSLPADPWGISLLLLGLPLFAASRDAAGLLLTLAFALVAAVASRKFLHARSRPPRLPLRQLAAVALVIPSILLLTALLTRDLPPVPPLAAVGAPAGPNVIVLLLDTVRADHMSIYGYERETTPRLKGFADRATTYTRAVATSNWTLPTHASIFTGLYPRRHGAMNQAGRAESPALAPQHETLAEILEKSGYLNLAVIANAGNVRPEYGLARGFHLFDVRDLAPCFSRRPEHLRHGARRLLNRIVPTAKYDKFARRAEDINRDALRLIEEAKRRGGPFFLFVNYMDAHEPYLPPPPFLHRFPGRSRVLTHADFQRMREEVVSRRRLISEEERAHFISQYDGAIAYMDHQIGALFDRLEQMGLYDESLLVVTSDHGEAFGEKSLVAHAKSLYQHELGVPLIVKYPGQREPRIVDAPASLVDLMPTILDAAEIPAPAALQGQSLLAPAGERIVFAEAVADALLASLLPQHPRRQYAAFEGSHKLILSSDGNLELYDLSRDAGELRNLAPSGAAPAHRLRRALDAWLEANPLEIRPPRQLDATSLERLKALGYVR
ncbi:MAG: sulfatase [Bryobacteraceae bacterium]|nr:sulfatase [Bryobacteraceae bacterium]